MNAHERFHRAIAGHIESIDDLTDGDASDVAWAFSIRCAQANAQPHQSPWPDLSELRHIATGSKAANIVLRGVALGVRDAVLRFDHGIAEEWSSRARALSTTPPASFLLACHLEQSEGASFGPDPDKLDTRALRARAIEDQETATVVDLAVAQAWDAEAAGALEDALSAARRASRMARTEALPQQEYFANLMLARCRRLVGHPHLAVRILSALRRFVSPQWHPWLAWELLMSGATAAAEAALINARSGGQIHSALHAAGRLMRAARQGRREAFDAASGELQAACACSRRLKADADALIGAIDARIERSQTPSHLRAWLEGSETKPPRGLHGLAADLADSDSLKGALVFVGVSPGHEARRVLGPGLPLMVGHQRLRQSQRRQGRMDTAVAVLALAGREGLELEELFKRVYEFDFDPEIHAGALRKLLVRVQEWLGPLAHLHADSNRRWLEVVQPLVVADPRSVPPVDVRVLAVLASSGSTSAKEAAKRLRIPLRTAQAALQDLLGDGTAQRVRTGNVVEYHLEDTTFTEPTRY
ncbi:MAG: hypothetical protein AB8H86_33045 [Polyangiales bacterium]